MSIGSWRELNNYLADMDEDQVKKLLLQELEGEKRATVVVRLHQRFSILRAARERADLLARITEGGTDE